jgi:DNA-binding response OmpR family regulator
MLAQAIATGKGRKILLVGPDEKQILEKRFRRAGCLVVGVADNATALDCARHERISAAVLISRGSLINVVEAVFNLRDLNPSMEIIVLVDRLGKHSNRFLRQMLEHPIESTEVLTRRQLQMRLHDSR